MINTQRVLDSFVGLVKVDNPSGAEGPMAQYVMARLRELGLDPSQDTKGNVFAEVPGRGEPLLLNAHLDSVAPAVGKEPVVRDGYVYSAGETVLGSDDLAGVAAILEAVTSLREDGGHHRAAEVVFTVEEEIGLNGARALDYSRIRSRQGVALDLNGELGGICILAPAHDVIDVVVQGRPAHAGLAPEKGIDAVRVAAEAIAAMPLGRIDHETTANIGVIAGGTAKNIVPARVTIQAEARSRDEAKLDRQTEAMHQAFATAAAKYGAELEFHARRAYGPIRMPEDAPVVCLCRAAVEMVGLTPRLVETGGGSDVNIFNMHGIEAVNLSVGYHEIHTSDEHIAVADLERAARLVEALLRVEA